jgi:hypothetical protein
LRFLFFPCSSSMTGLMSVAVTVSHSSITVSLATSQDARMDGGLVDCGSAFFPFSFSLSLSPSSALTTQPPSLLYHHLLPLTISPPSVVVVRTFPQFPFHLAFSCPPSLPTVLLVAPPLLHSHILPLMYGCAPLTEGVSDAPSLVFSFFSFSSFCRFLPLPVVDSTFFALLSSLSSYCSALCLSSSLRAMGERHEMGNEKTADEKTKKKRLFSLCSRP